MDSLSSGAAYTVARDQALTLLSLDAEALAERASSACRNKVSASPSRAEFLRLRQRYFELEGALLACPQDCGQAQGEYVAARDAFWSARVEVLKGNLPAGPADQLRERYFRLDRNFGRLMSECRGQKACESELRAEYVEARECRNSRDLGLELPEGCRGGGFHAVHAEVPPDRGDEDRPAQGALEAGHPASFRVCEDAVRLARSVACPECKELYDGRHDQGFAVP